MSSNLEKTCRLKVSTSNWSLLLKTLGQERLKQFLHLSKTNFCFSTKFPWKKIESNRIPQKNTWKLSLWHKNKSRKAFMCLLLTKESPFNWLEPTPRGRGLVWFCFCLFHSFPVYSASSPSQWQPGHHRQEAPSKSNKQPLILTATPCCSLKHR